MDENRLKKICSKILEKYNFSITSFRLHPTHQLCEDGVWREYSYCVFIEVTRTGSDHYERVDVSKLMEDYVGCEFIVDFSY
jgi:hypothetical protein